MDLKLFCFIFLLLLVTLSETKRSRGGGRGRGSSSGSTSFWNRKNGKGSSSSPQKPAAELKPVYQPQPAKSQSKPSAPKEPDIKKENANFQQSAPPNSGKPIGWNVDNNKPVGLPNTYAQKQNVNPSHSSGLGVNPPPYSPASYGHAPPAYSPYGHAPSAYGQAPPAYSPYGHAPPAYSPYGHPPNPYNSGGYGHNPSPYGHNPYSGGYHPNMGGYGGYGHQPGMMGGYPQQQTGLMGSLFGGNKHGYGAYGGYGGYGMKKSGGFFGKHAFRNVLGGLAVWYLVSGLIRRPYTVHSYYTVTKEERQEITLPANVLTLCDENATSICVPGSTGICTQDNRILCVTTMAATTPCLNNAGELCVNSTIPCLDTNDPLCQNKTSGNNTTTVDLPCFTNMTLEAGASLAPNVMLPVSADNKFCVTAMAVPEPDNGTNPEQKESNRELHNGNADTKMGPEQENQTPANFSTNDYVPPYYPYGYGYGYGYMPQPVLPIANVTGTENKNITDLLQE